MRQVQTRSPEEQVQRFETEPGHQAHMDFADFRFAPWGRRYVLIAVLGYSRSFSAPSARRSGRDPGLEAVFVHFCGMPAEVC